MLYRYLIPVRVTFQSRTWTKRRTPLWLTTELLKWKSKNCSSNHIYKLIALYRLSYTGTWHCVALQVDLDVSEELAVSVFMVEIISSFSRIYKSRRSVVGSVNRFIYPRFHDRFWGWNISQLNDRIILEECDWNSETNRAMRLFRRVCICPTRSTRLKLLIHRQRSWRGKLQVYKN
jgi:hypothetical protein